MAWEDEEIEQFLKQFRLKQSERMLPPVEMQRTNRPMRAAAAILAIAGAAFAVQYMRTTESSPSSGLDTFQPIAVAQTSAPAPVPAPAPAPPAPDAIPAPAIPAETQTGGSHASSIDPLPAAPKDSGPPQRKLAPETNRLTATVVIPEQSPPAAATATPGNLNINHPDAYREYLNQNDKLRREQLEQEAEKWQAEADPGKRTFDSACVQCHAADVMNNHVYSDPAQYRQIVTDMVGKGALISEPQINPLVDYLMRTYGVRKKPAP